MIDALAVLGGVVIAVWFAVSLFAAIFYWTGPTYREMPERVAARRIS